MTFQGWPEEALDFYDGLEADNSKTYWLAHKHVYETCVLQPMTELLDELGPDHGEGKIFRPYRDVRFSKDKSPYKTAIGAVIGDGYIQLSARGLGVGSGMWQMAPDQLERYRRAVAADHSGAELEDDRRRRAHAARSTCTAMTCSSPPPAGTRRITRGSSGCAARGSQPGRSGRCRRGWGQRVRRSGSRISWPRPRRSTAGWTSTSDRLGRRRTARLV